MKIKEVYDICMPAEKRKKENKNIWVAWVVRPLSVLFTLPLVHTKVRPNHVTLASIFVSIIGFCMCLISKGNISIAICGWLCFFIWAVLDGVDGNLARCQSSSSPLGEMWDAMGGYTAMSLIYMASGVLAFYDVQSIDIVNNCWYLLIAGFTAIFSILPRLIMHRKNSLFKTNSSKSKLNDKANFGIKQILVMNLISVSGFMQPLMLIAIITHSINIYICLYLLLNFIIMILSLKSLFSVELSND